MLNFAWYIWRLRQIQVILQLWEMKRVFFNSKQWIWNLAIVAIAYKFRDGMGSQSCNWFNTQKKCQLNNEKKILIWELKEIVDVVVAKALKDFVAKELKDGWCCCKRIRAFVNAIRDWGEELGQTSS